MADNGPCVPPLINLNVAFKPNPAVVSFYFIHLKISCVKSRHIPDFHQSLFLAVVSPYGVIFHPRKLTPDSRRPGTVLILGHRLHPVSRSQMGLIGPVVGSLNVQIRRIADGVIVNLQKAGIGIKRILKPGPAAHKPDDHCKQHRQSHNPAHIIFGQISLL